MTASALSELIAEYHSAQAHTMALVHGLDENQVFWRPDENSSAIGWHLGHQAAVNHYMVRNLTAAEVSFNVEFDRLFDSATPERQRTDLPSLGEIVDYRDNIAASTATVMQRIDSGDVGAPAQLAIIADGLLRAVISHEYQHAQWVGQVRSTMLDTPTPVPASQRLRQVDGYWLPLPT